MGINQSKSESLKKEFFSNVSSGNIDALKKQKKKFPSYWNINITDHNGKSALILSVINAALGEKTTTPILKFLFEDPDTDLLIRDLQGHTCLHYACLHGALIIVVYMLEASRRKYYSEEKLRSFLNTKNNDGITALHFSVQSKNLELVKRLVYAGADVNACDSVGVTPLHLAADFQECAAFLISKNAQFQRDLRNQSPLTLADLPVQREMMKEFEKNRGILFSTTQDLVITIPKVVKHISNNDLESLKTAFNPALGKADRTATIMNQAFALHIAIDNNNREIVAWLLQKGVDVNLCREGITPAIQCVTNDQADILRLLIENKTPKLDLTKLEEETKNSVLHYGAYNNSVKCMNLLLDSRFGLNPDIKNAQSYTPLIMASYQGFSEIVKLLIHFRVNVMTTDSQGNTALHAAMKMHHWNLAATLIKAGADYNAKNLGGISPYMLASTEMKQKIDEWTSKTPNLSNLQTGQLKDNDSNSPSDDLNYYSLLESTDLTIIRASELNLHSEIGSGGFGEVWKGTYKGIFVAIKKLHVQELDTGMLDTLQNEAVLLHKSNHPNVLQLIGVCLDSNSRCLVTEFMEKGSLRDVLLKNIQNKTPFSLNAIVKVMYYVAKGMAHLHSLNIIHRDLKPENILINKKWEIKVADFGLAKIRNHTETKLGKKGTARYMAPELMLNAKGTEKVDVFSYSILCYETFLERRAYLGIQGVELCLKVANEGLRPDVTALKTKCDHPEIIEIITTCWKQNPEERLSFERILKKLGPIREEVKRK